MYPQFKFHKLSTDDIVKKILSPLGGTTYLDRLGALHIFFFSKIKKTKPQDKNTKEKKSNFKRGDTYRQIYINYEL